MYVWSLVYFCVVERWCNTFYLILQYLYYLLFNFFSRFAICNLSMIYYQDQKISSYFIILCLNNHCSTLQNSFFLHSINIYQHHLDRTLSIFWLYWSQELDHARVKYIDNYNLNITMILWWLFSDDLLLIYAVCSESSSML